jgi:hypothetical protein
LPSDVVAKLGDMPVSGSTDPPSSLDLRFVRLVTDHFYYNRHLESHLTGLQNAASLSDSIVWWSTRALAEVFQTSSACEIFLKSSICAVQERIRNQETWYRIRPRNPGGPRVSGLSGNKVRNGKAEPKT